MSEIAEKVALVRENIARAAEKSGRTAAEITLVAAVKTQSAERIRDCIAAGIDAVGENRVQEVTEKLPQGAYAGVPLHFIGHLQQNKLKKIVGVCDLIQSVDSEKLLRQIAVRAAELGVTQEVLLEVNLAREASKTGMRPEELEAVLGAAASLPAVRVRGLMAIAPISPENHKNQPFFEQMQQLFVDIAAKKYNNVSMDFLSMGMSGDYAEAIAAGANMVRVGSAIFGERKPALPAHL